MYLLLLSGILIVKSLEYWLRNSSSLKWVTSCEHCLFLCTCRVGICTSSLPDGLEWELICSMLYLWPLLYLCPYHLHQVSANLSIDIIHKIYSVLCLLAGLNPALIGLSLAYALSLAGVLEYVVRQSAEVESLVSLSHYFFQYWWHEAT